ncbi:LysE family translocator [Streptomyces sedi]|uniref:LysE family translocator n=1 Tax=Streptomyces sedi TaxID=555059 RepID=A0A5C4V3D6_9ACTN|nr:LysE family translocator [Streptomyces sedi]TNM29936.1 LysE family translocator [Streptomyces sedi]
MTPRAAAGGFALAVLPLVATPGASLALLTRHVAEAGRGRALPVILGTASGVYVHAAMAMAGLSALVVGSETAFAVLRSLGAVYLIVLAGWTWRRTGPGESGPRSRGSVAARRPRGRFAASPWLQSLLGTVLNPKAAAVYLTLAPQFLDPARPLGGQLLLLATVHVALVGGWLALWAALLTRPGTALTRPRARVAIGRVSALALLALGIGAVASL